MNYRLGVYGFLSLNDSTLNVPGNAGLKDQRLALHWVKQNIANFGGNLDQVTLFGFSAGGGSTHYHMLSESSRGLFHRAIVMGGNAMQNVGRIFKGGEWARILSQRLGFGGDLSSDRQILEFLENADPESVVMNSLGLIPIEGIVNGDVVPFGPTSELFETEGIFLKANVFDLIENAWSNEIPLLTGMTSMESLTGVNDLRASPRLFAGFINFENFIPLELGVERNTSKSRKYAEMIKNVYYPVFEPTISNIDGMLFVRLTLMFSYNLLQFFIIFDSLFQLFSDNDLWFPTLLTARYRLRAGNKSPTYIYRFDAETDYDIVRNLDSGFEFYRYPSHGIDMLHLFKSVFHKSFSDVSNATRQTVELMTTSFTNFAATGDPSAPELGIYWNPVSSENELLIGLNIHETESEFMVLPEAKRMHVFTEIWDTEMAEI